MVTPSNASTFGSATAAATVPGTFKYDSNNPETLIGAKVEVTWKRNRKYLGKIETYEVDGQHKGKHKCIYDDGDIKYYKIKVMRKGDRTKLVNQHYKDSTTGTGVITVKKWKNSGAAVVPPSPVAGFAFGGGSSGTAVVPPPVSKPSFNPELLQNSNGDPVKLGSGSGSKIYYCGKNYYKIIC